MNRATARGVPEIRRDSGSRLETSHRLLGSAPTSVARLGRELTVRGGLVRLRAMVMRVGLTGADQCVASLSNFAVGVAIARVAGIAALGAFSLAYVVWLCMAAAHRALVVEPMAIDNDVRTEDAIKHVRIGLAGELALGAGFGATACLIGVVLLAFGQHSYGIAFFAFAPWVPCLLVQDYWRWVAFMKAAPRNALTNDLLFDGVQAVAFLLLFELGLHSSVLAIGAWGLGALAGSFFGLWQHSVTPSFRGGLARIRERWSVSRGLLGGSVTGWGAAQLYVVLTGALLGPVGIGGLRAAQSLVSGPTFVLLQAGGSIGLPEASKALHERGWNGLQNVGRAVTAAGALSIAAVGVVVLVFGRRLLVLLYGAQFGRFAITADILALSVLVGAMSLGPILALKTTKLTGLLFGCSVVSLVVSAIGVVVLVPMFGLDGAAGAAVAGNGIGSLVQVALHHRNSRGAADRLLTARGSRAIGGHPSVGTAKGPEPGGIRGNARSNGSSKPPATTRHGTGDPARQGQRGPPRVPAGLPGSPDPEDDSILWW